MVRNFDARIHQKTTLQIQTSNTKTATEFTVSLRAQDLRKIGTRPNRNRQFTNCRTRRDYPRPKISRLHLILCALGLQHPPRRTEYTRKRTGTRDGENNNKHEPHVRLFSNKSECTSQILSIQHYFKRSLRCVLTFSKRRQESCRWTFLTRLGTRR